MKTHTFLIILFFTFSAQAQEIDTTQTPVMRAYNVFLNYTPKSLEGLPIPESFAGLNPDNLANLHFLYVNKEVYNFQRQNLRWLMDRINALAEGFYTEGNPVILRTTGGYGGCPENEFELNKETINSVKVTVVNFCHGCKGFSPDEKEFIEIFNSRTKALIAGRR